MTAEAGCPRGALGLGAKGPGAQRHKRPDGSGTSSLSISVLFTPCSVSPAATSQDTLLRFSDPGPLSSDPTLSFSCPGSPLPFCLKVWRGGEWEEKVSREKGKSRSLEVSRPWPSPTWHCLWASVPSPSRRGEVGPAHPQGPLYSRVRVFLPRCLGSQGDGGVERKRVGRWRCLRLLVDPSAFSGGLHLFPLDAPSHLPSSLTQSLAPGD